MAKRSSEVDGANENGSLLRWIGQRCLFWKVTLAQGILLEVGRCLLVGYGQFFCWGFVPVISELVNGTGWKEIIVEVIDSPCFYGRMLPVKASFSVRKDQVPSPRLCYALAIAASQAFSAPTTVKHINGLMAYII